MRVAEPTFAPLYRRFLALIAQPRPLAEVARERAVTDAGAAPLGRWITAPDEEQAAERLGIYAHMYFARLRDSLRDDYAALARIAGDAAFEALAVRYLVHHPSDNPSLRYHGRHFPAFLVRELATAPASLRPDLADLAALEWARIEAFDALAGTPLTPDELGKVEPEAWAALPLALLPCCRVLDTAHSATSPWLAAEREETPPPPQATPERVLVWRRGFGVYHRKVSGDEARALALLARPATFGELCGLFDDGRPTAETALRALTVLKQWLADEIVGVPPPRPMP